MSDIEVVQQTRMEFLVFLHSVVIYHVREAGSYDECLLELRRVCAAWSLVLVESHVIVIDREVQV